MFKTEPSDFSYDDLEKKKESGWDGVRNAQALIHLRQVAAGDDVLIYHTGSEKSVIGLARATGPARPDPKDTAGKMVIVPVVPVRRLPRSVPIAVIRGEKALAEFPLIKNTRLSVMPVKPAEFRAILALAGA
ncbi:MAG TPA: EVE domain-containing protein [Candidatus Eisenbacteria bacterium]